MNTHPSHRGRKACTTLLILGATLVSAPALAATAAGRGDAQRIFERDRAACLANTSNQDRATCLREASAALMEARRGGLAGDAAAQQANRLRRCEPLPEAYRRDCIARMSGQGTAEGSAAAGGIYRELVTREPVASAPAVKDTPTR
jgi:hypothetical protein